MSYTHIPVMLEEVLKYLNPKAGDSFIDCTLGGAGYTLALAKAVGENGRVVSIDLDGLAIENAKQLLLENNLKNVSLVQDNFRNLPTIIEEYFSEFGKFNGIVFDLGLSSAQLSDKERGFSFQGEQPLDMSFGPVNDRSTRNIINTYPLLELTRVFREYGEEKRAYQIAKRLVDIRRSGSINSTAELVNIIESIILPRFRRKIHPATRVFQALRMETNDELGALSSVLPETLEILKPHGRLVTVSFHSGEDRIVKRFFKNSDCLNILTKKPIIPGESEVQANPRSRSAKLRAASLNF